MNEIMIEARGISKSYGQVTVLSGVDLDIEKHKITSISGASGAGKTTLLQILGTLNAPDAGSLTIGGTHVDGLKGNALSAFRNQRIGFIFQFHRLLPEFTAVENVLMPAWIQGNESSRHKDRAERLLKDLGLGSRLHHLPNQLSGGEQQRVAAARALMNEPDVVLADEPTGSLDKSRGEDIIDLLKSLCVNNQTSLVVVTHDVEIASQMKRRLCYKN